MFLARAVTRSTLTDGPISISYRVTVGPRLNPDTSASTLNWVNTSWRAVTTMSLALVRAFGVLPGRSSVAGGSAYVPTTTPSITSSSGVSCSVRCQSCVTGLLYPGAGAAAGAGRGASRVVMSSAGAGSGAGGASQPVKSVPGAVCSGVPAAGPVSVSGSGPADCPERTWNGRRRMRTPAVATAIPSNPVSSGRPAHPKGRSAAHPASPPAPRTTPAHPAMNISSPPHRRQVIAQADGWRNICHAARAARTGRVTAMSPAASRASAANTDSGPAENQVAPARITAAVNAASPVLSRRAGTGTCTRGNLRNAVPLAMARRTVTVRAERSRGWAAALRIVHAK